MKKYLLLPVLLLVLSSGLKAQTEIKLNPVALLFLGIGAGVEYGFNPEFGVELNTLIVEGGAAVWAAGKYYFNPRQGLDRFYVGAYLGGVTDSDGPGLGFLLGTKTVSRNNKLLFEVGVGAGRSFSGGFLPYGRISLGYRFGQQ